MIELFDPHRELLFGIAYRMLGRVSEVEDMIQETWLRWQRQNPAEIQSPKAWLVSTITRLCIDQLRSARHEREEYYGVWLPEPLVESHQPGPDESAALAESLTMAFMLLLETLGPEERAIFLLREVFDYDYAAIAAMVDKTEASCRQIVRRAKMRFLAQSPATAPASEHARRVVNQFIATLENGRVEELVKMLTADATLYSDGGGRVSAAGRPIKSADHVSRFLAGIRPRYPADTIFKYVGINGRPGVLMLSQGQIYNAISFDLVGDRVQTIYIVRNPEKLRHLIEGKISTN